MSNENVSNTPLRTSHGRTSTPLPPKPPPPPPLKQNTHKHGSPATTDDIVLPSIDESLSSSSPQKKPSPAPKPSRLSRAFSTGYITLPSFLRHHKRSNTAKENGKVGKINGKEKAMDKHQDRDTKDEKANESTVATDTVSTTDTSSTTDTTIGTTSTTDISGPELRDAPLWKLPGLETVQKRHSMTSLGTNGIPKPRSMPTSQELPENTTQVLKHSPPDVPHKTTTAVTNRELPQLPDTPPQLPKNFPPDLPPKSDASTTQGLPEHPNTPPQLPKHFSPDPSPKLPATNRELPELPDTLPQSQEHQPSPKPSPATTTRELPQLPDFHSQFPTRSESPAIPIPYCESLPMEESPPPELPLRPEGPLKAATSDEAIRNPEDCKSNEGKVSPSPIPPAVNKGTLPDTEKAITLREVVQKYSNSFPIRIRVLQGYCSEDSEVNISTDDMYNIHFVKHTKVVTIRDEDGVTYSLPLGSAMKFGLIYNPSSNLDEALSGYDFERVSNIMAAPIFPKIIRATKSVHNSDDKSALEEGELLVIHHVHKTLLKGRKGLKVFSLLTKSEKILLDDCCGHFSTKPSLVQLNLPEIVQYIPSPFPSLAVMYSTSGSTMQLHNLPGTQSRVITMCGNSSETSLVASPATEEGSESEKQILFDIPLNDDISDMEVEVIQSQNEEESEHLYDDTLNIFNEFDPNKLQSLKGTPTSPPSTTQSSLHRVRSGYETVGIDIEPPYVNISKLKSITTNQDAEREAEDQSNGYATVGFQLSSRWHSYGNEDNESVGYDHVGYDKPDVEGVKLTSWVQDLHSATQALESRLSMLESGQPSAEMGRLVFYSRVHVLRS